MNKKPLLFALSALLLASCSGGGGGEAADTSSMSKSDESSLSHDASVSSTEDTSVDTREETSHDEGSSIESGQDSSGQEGSSADTSADSSEEIQTSWRDNEITTMQSMLHGMVIPFIDLDPYTFGVEQGFVNVSAYNGDVNYLPSLCAKFETDGWTLVPGRMRDVEGVYCYEKGIDTDAGKRYVSVTFVCMNPDTDEVDSTGIFQLMATDPFMYGNPIGLFVSDADDLLKNEIVVLPSLTVGDHYLFLGKTGDSVILEACGLTDQEAENYIYSVLEYGYQLAGSGQGYVTVTKTEGNHYILFQYLDEARVLRMTLAKNPTFPVSDLMSFFHQRTSYPPEEIYVPFVASTTETTFSFYENSAANNYYEQTQNWNSICAEIRVNNYDEDDYADYLDALYEAGWEIDPRDSKQLLNRREDGSMYAMKIDSYSWEASGQSRLVITFYAIARQYIFNAWPLNPIAQLMPFDATETFPAYNWDVESVRLDYLANGFTVDVTVPESGVAGALGRYEGILTALQYQVFDVDRESSIDYVKSPQGEICLRVQGTDRGFLITYYENTIDPVSRVLAQLPDVGQTRVLPPIVLDSSLVFNTIVDNSDWEECGCVNVYYPIVASMDRVAVKNAYGQLLEEAGYVYDDDDTELYVSPCGTTYVDYFFYQDTLNIEIYDASSFGD